MSRGRDCCRGRRTDPGERQSFTVHERTVLERSTENVKDLLLNAVGVDLVLEEA
jgi:hypothetical protein